MMTQNQTINRRIHRKAGKSTMAGRAMCLTLTMAITAFTQTANADEAKRNIWRGWNAFEPDPEALGYASISTRSNSGKAPDASEIDRIATYLVPFADAGTYDLHVRLQHGGTMFFSKVFGNVYEWQEARSPIPADGGYSWINLSETYKSKQKDLTYAVDAFRPDHVTRDHDRRYSQIVGTDVPYGSEFERLGWDRDDLNMYQNILANAGICGRRAFFGRFILRAFGNPTTARSEPGHAALVRWTPDGWVPYLGGGWGVGNRTIFHHYPSDLDFLASTQARVNPEMFMKVKRAQWIGSARGEGIQFGYHDNVRRRELGKYVKQSLDQINVPGAWNIVSSVTQHAVIRELSASAREAVDAELGESTEPQLDDDLAPIEIPATERNITVNGDGMIHIPAAASTTPTNNTDAIRFMPSNRGGIQVHFGQQAGADILEYTIDAPKAGKYHLTANLVTPAPKQHLFLKINGATDRIDVQLPYTIGMWGELEPVEIELNQGKNTLSFQRGHYFQRGVSIRAFTLTPIK